MCTIFFCQNQTQGNFLWMYHLRGSAGRIFCCSTVSGHWVKLKARQGGVVVVRSKIIPSLEEAEMLSFIATWRLQQCTLTTSHFGESFTPGMLVAANVAFKTLGNSYRVLVNPLPTPLPSFCKLVDFSSNWRQLKWHQLRQLDFNTVSGLSIFDIDSRWGPNRFETFLKGIQSLWI